LDKAGGVIPANALMACRQWAERRVLATAHRLWPEVKWSVTSEPVSYDTYVEKADPKRVINSIVADTYRLLHYPEMGFMVATEVPKHIKETLHTLIKAGFVGRLPADYTEKYFAFG
jgi:hypothetical protein